VFCCIGKQVVDPPSVRKDRRGRIVKPLIDDTQVYHTLFVFIIVMHFLCLPECELQHFSFFNAVGWVTAGHPACRRFFSNNCWRFTFAGLAKLGVTLKKLAKITIVVRSNSESSSYHYYRVVFCSKPLILL